MLQYAKCFRWTVISLPITYGNETTESVNYKIDLNKLRDYDVIILGMTDNCFANRLICTNKQIIVLHCTDDINLCSI